MVLSGSANQCYRLGFPKRVENFIFFTIQDVAGFKKALKQLQPLITSTAEVQEARKHIQEFKMRRCDGLMKFVGTNIAFSAVGLKKVCISISYLRFKVLTFLVAWCYRVSG